MYISLQTKILLTVLIIVSLFTFFTLFYFPSQQRRFLQNTYDNEVQNFSNTVALGVRIALNEQNYEGVQTAMDFVKGNPNLRFVSLVETDTAWNEAHTKYQLSEKIFKTYPDGAVPTLKSGLTDSLIVKRTDFHSSVMDGAIVLGFSTAAITESQQAIFYTSLLVSGGIFLIGLLIGLWTSHNLSAPVMVLHNASRRIAGGDLTPVVAKFSNDEIGDLAKAFNNMVKDLSDSREALHATNRKLSEANTTLSATLEDLQATQQQLIQSEKMASLGELTAGIAHEIQNPLNFINNFSEVNSELLDELAEQIEKGAEKQVQDSIEEIKENEKKILHHGRRADGIVKSMLHHSRKNSDKKEPTDINLLADEYLRLCYHGIRAKDKNFEVKMVTDFDKKLNKVEVAAQEIGRVLLNLFSNAFYSVSEKQKMLNGSYQPTVKVTTIKEAASVFITVQDNGNGIPQHVLDKIFQPFFTTKPTGKGTGLGLSLCYDVVTKQHGGHISVESVEGEGATFVVQLPVSA